MSPIKTASDLTFTGERVVEGITPRRIWLDHVARYEFAAKYVKDKTVLDVACGTGFGSKILRQKGGESVFGVDLSEEAIAFACHRYFSSGLNFMVGNILEMGFSDNSFDVAVSFETIEHIPEQQKALVEFRRVLRPRGLLIISSPNRNLTSPGKSINDSPKNEFHLVEYSHHEFVRMLSRCFDIRELYGQRPISKVLLLPILEHMGRKFASHLYSPEAGKPLIEKQRALRAYRYITALCANTRK